MVVLHWWEAREGRRRIREIAISNMVKNGFEKDMIDDVAKNCKNRLEKNLDGWTESSECQTHLILPTFLYSHGTCTCILLSSNYVCKYVAL